MRPRSRRDTSVEVFSAMRSEKAIRRADICLLVIDIAAGITQQDRRIAGIIAEEGKPCIIIVNKFDLFHPNAPRKDRMVEVEEQVRRELFFINHGTAQPPHPACPADEPARYLQWLCQAA
mgnify:CR=1 FL=1